MLPTVQALILGYRQIIKHRADKTHVLIWKPCKEYLKCNLPVSYHRPNTEHSKILQNLQHFITFTKFTQLSSVWHLLPEPNKRYQVYEIYLLCSPAATTVIKQRTSITAKFYMQIKLSSISLSSFLNLYEYLTLNSDIPSLKFWLFCLLCGSLLIKINHLFMLVTTKQLLEKIIRFQRKNHYFPSNLYYVRAFQI
jgi:hypothetical protein